MKKQSQNFNSQVFRFFLFAALLTFSACQKETIVPVANEAFSPGEATALKTEHGLVEYPTLDRSKGQVFFDFEVLRYFCFQQGASYEVQIDNQQAYSFLWEVDERPAGHSTALACSCGKQATVYVTRLRDGLRVGKSLPLPGCDEGLDN